jgi:hypothetical protein
MENKMTFCDFEAVLRLFLKDKQSGEKREGEKGSESLTCAL